MPKYFFKNNAVLLAILMSIASSYAQASPTQELQSDQTPQFLDASRDQNGLVIKMRLGNAFSYCRGIQESHVPSPREWARYAMSRGAKGIKEVVNGKPEDNSYELINTIEGKDIVDSFYYSHKGYQPPSERWNQNLFWTSAIPDWSAGRMTTSVYVFDGKDGRFSITSYRRDFRYTYEFPVRCVSEFVVQIPPVSVPTEQRIAPNTGAIFTRDRSNPKLGEAYRDPSGLIWGNVISEAMNHEDALQACWDLNARLPFVEEIESLRKYLGTDSEKGYSPYLADLRTEVLPGLAQGNWFWSSEITIYNSSLVFNGDNGSTRYEANLAQDRSRGAPPSGHLFKPRSAVRCVTQAR